MWSPPIGSRSLHWSAILVVAALLSGCAALGGDESTITCLPPSEGEGWRVAAHEAEGGSPREIPLPGGSLDASAQILLAEEETCIAGAFERMPSAMGVSVSLDSVPGALLTFELGGVGGGGAWTCRAQQGEEPQSGELDGGVSFLVEPSADGCALTLSAQDGAALDGGAIGWRVEELEGGGDVRFSASRA